MLKNEVRQLWLFARWIDALLDASSRDIDLSPVQLFTLRFIGLHEQPILSDVASALRVSNAAATKMIDRLVKKGLVVRIKGQGDRREKRLALTDRGGDILEEALTMGQGCLADFLAAMDVGDRTCLERGIRAFFAVSLREPGDVQRICLRCGREHARECPGEDSYRRLGGKERKI